MQHHRGTQSASGVRRHTLPAMVVAERWIGFHACHQVRFGEGRDLLQILKALNIARLKPSFTPAPVIERDLPRPVDHRPEPPLPKRLKRVTRQQSRSVQKGRPHRIVGNDPLGVGI